MADRISVITTRTGDGGTTALGDGTRVAKSHRRIEALGQVDELNCTIGVLRAESLPEDVDQTLAHVQNDLFDLGGELCIPGTRLVGPAHVQFLDQRLARDVPRLGRLKEFILPAGTRAVALAQLTRAVCRRAERALARLADAEDVGEFARQYLNRLSDLCFVLARVLIEHSGEPPVFWQHEVVRRPRRQPPGCTAPAAQSPGRPTAAAPATSKVDPCSQ